jgi:alkylated DNA repair dioxygenase AlkB
VQTDGASRAVGDGEAHRYRVPVQPPTRSLPAQWSDLPNLDELRTRQPHEPRAPHPIPSTRFSPGDGPRVPRPRAANAQPSQPSMLLAGLTSQYSSSISALLNDLGSYGFRVSEGDYYGEAGAHHVTDAKFGRPPIATADGESEDAEFPSPVATVSNSKLAGRVLAFQSVKSSAFVSQSVPTSMIAGQSYTVSVTMKNTGTTTWTSAGYGYNLGSQTPQDNQTWGTHRAYLPSTATVAPGNEYTYSFTVTAPSAAGTYNFQWRTVHDGVEWFGAYSDNVVVSVTQSSGAVNASSFVSQVVPSTMVAGQSYPVSVTMQNTGTVSWTSANLYNLGSQNPQDNQTWGMHRVPVSATVGPGQTTTFNFTVAAPVTPATYNFMWRTVQDPIEWFGAYTTNVAVTVTTGISDTAWVDDAVPSGATVAGDTDGWNWVNASPAPYSGALAHRSNVIGGIHQHYFYDATNTLPVNGGDKLYTYVYPDPSNPPGELMLQWNDGTWEHRAYWGANNIPWGTDGTNSRRYMGALPPAGQWTRLEVPAALLGLEGQTLNGMAFSMYGGRATWDRAGKVGGPPPPPRLEAINRVGGSGDDLLSRNFNWGVPLLSLKGRSGLDLGLSLSYNSLVWTKNGTAMVFNGDQGDPTPGFRLGFPIIQAQHYNAQLDRNGHILLLPSGQRVELRATTANTYESQDSSYLKLIDYGFGLLNLWTTDGSRHTYIWRDNAYRCAEIMDRNGNYISISYDSYNRISTITDTLARTITFEYDAFNKPIKIRQSWQRQVLSGSSVTTQTETHDWATFGYTNLTVQTNFPGHTLSGVSNGQSIPVLAQVGLADGTRFNFDYSTWGQVYRITRNTQDDDGIWRPREYVHYNLPQNSATAQSDCPRFTERRDWAENWNFVGGVATEALTTFSAWDATGASSEMTTPDGTTYKELYETAGWRKGLTKQTEIGAGGTRKKWTIIAWDHDAGAAAAAQVNPRTDAAPPCSTLPMASPATSTSTRLTPI